MLVIVCLAQFVVVLDATIVNVALPSIQHGLRFSVAELQWVVNAYTLVFGGFLLLGGRAADLLGRKRLFVAGLTVFASASLVDGLAQNSQMLIGARAFQGFGAALLSPAALSLVTTTFSQGRERTRALGIWSAIAAGGGAVGLLAGGILTSALSWQWIFFVNVPIGAIAVLAALRYLPESRANLGHRTFDIAGAVTVTGGLMLLVFTLVKAQSWGWASGQSLGLFAVSFGLLALFLIIESRSKSPLIRLAIFRNRSIAIGDTVMLLVGSGLFAMFFFASIYVQEVLGYTPIRAGLAFVPVALMIAAGAGAAQLLIRRAGLRVPITAGLAVATLGMIVLTQLPVAGSYPNVLAGLLPVSFGLGLTFVPVTLLTTSGLETRDAGLASGLLNTSQQVGGALGLAVLSTLAANRTSSVLSAIRHSPSHAAALGAQVDGFHVAFYGGAVLFAGGLIVELVFLRRRHLDAVNADGELAIAA